jgi:phosphoglycerol transferase MdoB-like AlkP superfamily enzyme
MIILIFALMDLLGGLAILNSAFYVLVLYLAYAHLVKGGFSLFGSILSGHFFDWMGAVDVIAGVVLLLINSHIALGFFPAVGWILIGKAIYTAIRALVGV